MKQLSSDLGRIHFKIGDMVKARYPRSPDGAFVELDYDIDGLVHISQVSEERIEKIKDVLDEDTEVEARVIKIDKDERRIASIGEQLQ